MRWRRGWFRKRAPVVSVDPLQDQVRERQGEIERRLEILAARVEVIIRK